MKQNPADWPTYTGDKDEWAQYAFPNHMPKHDAPIDVPLPYDRTNPNRNFKQLFGNSKEAADRVHASINLDGALNALKERIYFPAEIQARLGAPPRDFPHIWSCVTTLTGPRPHPINALILSNSTKRPLQGDGYCKAVFAAVWEKHWWPIIEHTAWDESGVIFHRLVPFRIVWKEARMWPTWTEQLIDHQLATLQFSRP